MTDILDKDSKIAELQSQVEELSSQLQGYKDKEEKVLKRQQEFKEKYMGKGKAPIMEKKYGELIVSLHEKGYTQAEIAKTLSISAQTVFRILKAKGLTKTK